jgi:hypothetical protein
MKQRGFPYVILFEEFQAHISIYALEAKTWILVATRGR